MKIKILLSLGLLILFITLGYNRAYRDVQTVPVHLSSALIHFYKSTISPAGSPDCKFHPSCSIYSKEAIEEHGFAQGWAMSFDRMTRCNNEMWLYPEILIEDEIKKFDPVPCK